MTFDEYWEGYWKPTGQPLIVDMAMKEIGQKAWDAALTTTAAPVAKLHCSDGLCATVPGMDNVEHFICRLIDHCEGETITEEFLHQRYADFLKWHEQRST